MRITPAGAATVTSVAIPNGRLEVPGTYLQTGSDGAVQLDSGDDWIASRVTPKTDWELSTLSAYVTAVATQGVYHLELYDNATGQTGEAWTNSLISDTTGAENRSYRQIISASNIARSGSWIRLTLAAHSGSDTQIDHVSIVERDGSTANGTTVPVELLFNGTSGITIPGGSTATSDRIEFPFNKNKSYLVILDIADSNGNIRYTTGSSDGMYKKDNTDSYDQQTVTDFGLFATYAVVVSEIEVFGDQPGKSLDTLKSGQDCGDIADVWVNSALTAYQLQRGKSYWIVAKGTDGDDFSMSVRRWNTNVGSAFPEEMDKSMYSTDGGATWTQCTQDSKPALWNIVLNASENHVPPLVYGRYNGKYVYLSGIGVREIPEAGVSLACDALTADTLYYVYLHDNSGTLTLEASTTAPTLSEGILVKTGATTHRYLGMIYPKELQSGYQGLIDCRDSRLVLNFHNPVWKVLGKLNPYASATTDDTLPVGQWEKWNAGGDDYRCDFLADGASVMIMNLRWVANASGVLAGFGIDEAAPWPDTSSNGRSFGTSEGTNGTNSVTLSGIPAFGFHSGWPIAFKAAGGPGLDFFVSYLGSETSGLIRV